MRILRKITSGIVLAAALAVLVVAVLQLWNYRQWDYLPLNTQTTSALDERARMIQDRVELLSKRVADMELLVLILMGTSGFYTVVFVASGYFSTLNFTRRAEQAMSELRQLKKEEGRQGPEKPPAPPVDDWVTKLFPSNLNEHTRLQVMQAEANAARLEKSGGSTLAVSAMYRQFAKLYMDDDRPRARFYLERAVSLAPSASAHYDLACVLAGDGELGGAARELTSAFRERSKILDDRLTSDTEPGGPLYALSETKPYDKVVDALLLNVSIGSKPKR